MNDEWEMIEAERLDRVTVAKVAELLPEGPSRAWAFSSRNASDFWEHCPDPLGMLWVLKGFGLDDDLRLMRVACRWLRSVVDKKRDSGLPVQIDAALLAALEAAEAAFANVTRGGMLDDARRNELGRQRRILSTLGRSESHERKALDLILSPLFDWVTEDEARTSAREIADAIERMNKASFVIYREPRDRSYEGRLELLRAQAEHHLGEVDLLEARRIAPDHGAYRRPVAIAEDVANLCQWALVDAELETAESVVVSQAATLRRIIGNPFA